MNNVKIGNVVRYVLGNYAYLGVVTEIHEIKDSLKKDDIGKIYYMVDNLSTSSLTKVTIDNIKEVYGVIDCINTTDDSKDIKDVKKKNSKKK